MNDAPKTNRPFPRILKVAISLFLSLIFSTLMVAFIMDHPSHPSAAIIPILLLTAIVFGLWLGVREIHSWRNARRALLSLAALATLIGTFYTVENWRGRRAWENCKRELEAEGLP